MLRWARQHKLQAVALVAIAQLLVLRGWMFLPGFLGSRLYMLQELLVYPWDSIFQGRYGSPLCMHAFHTCLKSMPGWLEAST